MGEMAVVTGVLSVFGVLIVLNAFESLRIVFPRRRVFYTDSAYRLEPLRYLPRGISAEVCVEAGEMGVVFWSEFLRTWLEVKRPDDQLLVLFGSTLQMQADRYVSYFEKYNPSDPQWTRCHPVLEHWAFNNSEANIRLFIKKPQQTGPVLPSISEQHYILVNGKDKVVLLEDKHYSFSPRGGVLHRRNEELYSEMHQFFMDRIDSSKDLSLEVTLESLSDVHKLIAPQLLGIGHSQVAA